MKNKDFGFFQLHAEKIALGAGLAVLIGIGATQFLLGGPNQIEINNRQIAPNEIKDTVVSEAQRLKRSLNADSAIEPREIPDYARSFVSLYTLPVATDQSLTPVDQVGLADTWVKVVQPEYDEKVLPDVPIVSDVFVKSGHGVLDSINDNQVFAIREMLNNPEPADFPYVSVRGKFSFAEWVDRLRSPDIPSVSRIEEGLWADRLAVTAVQLIREELDPATGEWGGLTEIDPLPGQYAILPDTAGTQAMGMDEAEQMEASLIQNQPAFRRPAFPPLANGPWTPPSATDRILTPEDLKRQREISEEITKLQRQIERFTETEQNAGSRGQGQRSTRGAEDMGFDDFSGDAGGRGRGQRDRTSRGAGNDNQPTPEERRLQQAYEKLEAAQREMDELLGVEADSSTTVNRGQDFDPSMMGDPGDFGNSGFSRPGRGGFNDPGMSNRGRGNTAADVPEEVQVWAHDLTIEPGKTYRYKLKVYVLNPLFRNPRLNARQIKENRTRISLGPDEQELAAAEWSPKVTVDQNHYFFVTSGNRDQKRADFEVWTIYDGMWRTQEFTEYPGNEIGEVAELEGVSGRVPMNVGSIMLDVDSVSNPNGGGSVVRVLYLDADTNQIRTRLVVEDKVDTERTRLQLERDRQSQQQNVQLGAAR